ncbi:MAG: uroporphyrinogen decarboxylase family protein [Anaerolineae bacterium]
MDSRERLLTALHNQKPDHLPAQVHSWMTYYLNTYLGGCDDWAAFERFGLDKVIYRMPNNVYTAADQANWQIAQRDLGFDPDGNHRYASTITTPAGTLTTQHATNAFTAWTTEFPIKNSADFAIWERYAPVPVRLDPTPVTEAAKRLGPDGIVRGGGLGYGQGSPWQDLCTLVDTEKAIYWGMDEPEEMHHMLQVILDKRLRAVQLLQGIPLDVFEVGGGAGSNTVISPSFFREFCLPYDKIQNEALHAVGMTIVYHLCGGLMHQLELVAETGADGLETMTPPSMGGDCELAAATKRVGDKLFFIGGFDQNAGFERGTPEVARAQVLALHAARPNGGYICCPSDHFFFGDPANIQAFADAAKECVY